MSPAPDFRLIGGKFDQIRIRQGARSPQRQSPVLRTKRRGCRCHPRICASNSIPRPSHYLRQRGARPKHDGHLAGTRSHQRAVQRGQRGRLQDHGRKGEIFGEIALLDGKDSTADAVAITACELLVVERRAFLPVLRRRPELCIRLLELLCDRLRRTDQQVEDLLIRHFENRLARTLLRLGQEHGLRERGAVPIDLSLSQTELANLAGGTRESVNRHLHSLERLGVIALTGSTIVIRDAEALEQLG